MERGASQGAGPGAFRVVTPKAFKLLQTELIKTSYMECGHHFPLVIQPNIENLNLAAWATANQDFLEAQLLKHGAILFRDFDAPSVSAFERFARAISPQLMDYRERAAPREEVDVNIYTSTEFPADQSIPLHHEMSYARCWPTKIWFFCLTPARQGGRTPIANDREVFRLIDPRIKERFIRKQIMYVRNYGEGLDLPWQEVFQTTNRSVVEAYCRRSDIAFEWKDGARLVTRTIRPAVATHPKTGEAVWFNHAHMFHVSNLEPEIRESLLARYKPDELPRNAFYGDGSTIETSALDEVRAIYDSSAVRFHWQTGDILMLDNFLASHGREPFTGPRKILVAMAELFSEDAGSSVTDPEAGY